MSDNSTISEDPVVSAHFSVSILAKQDGGFFVGIVSHGQEEPEFARVKGDKKRTMESAVMSVPTLLDGITGIAGAILKKLQLDHFHSVDETIADMEDEGLAEETTQTPEA